ncbi:MAG: class I SAM-dependent RNA methyltransferase [Deltaproteobacteria bacterium]|nr:class I SAM-dependent RNA methyltransferase [Deltaproteobacteria bacterium]
MQCPHHPACPGCPLLGLDYEAQLELKRERLAAALALYPHLALEAPPVQGSPHTAGYRHRVKLPVGPGGQVGLYDRAGERVVDTPSCPVLEPRLRAALVTLRRSLAAHREVHSVDLRVNGAGALQLVLACHGGELRGGGKAAAALAREVHGLVSVAVSRADPEGKRVMGAAPRLLAGSPFLDEQVGSARYRLHPGAFFQVDPRHAARLQALVQERVGGARTVADLYAGVGAYAIALADGRQRVVAVEEVPAAARAAREAAPRNVEVVEARVEGWARRVRERFDVAILNPARRGSSPVALATVARVAERLVYVSCGPETLARDLDVLAHLGMRVVDLAAIDLFPQTPEVETVVSLARGPALATWRCGRGHARGPWGGEPSGALGQPERVLALVVGDTGSHGTAGQSKYRRLATVATHSYLRLDLAGPLDAALGALARAGHPVAGADPRTARFFAEKSGLVRPFLHVEMARGGVVSPLHGDLQHALSALTGGRNAPGDRKKPSPPARPGGSRRRS